MKTNQNQFDGIEDPNWTWTSEHQDEMAHLAQNEYTKVASDPGDYDNPFIPKRINLPF